MKILVTGAEGFIGRNLVSELARRKDAEVLPFDLGSSGELLERYCAECDFVYNLAGVNRPKHMEAFMEGNFGFASRLVGILKKHHNKAPIMNASSVQAALDNPYGKSKKAGEDMLLSYGRETGTSVYIYRFPNIFGKWCRPNYNSVVATFCHNIARGLPIQINDRATMLRLAYIDDVVEELLRALELRPHMDAEGYCYVPVTHDVSLGEVADMLYAFKESRENLLIPNMAEGCFEKKLYSTYLSYLPEEDFSYLLEMKTDRRGCFTEILKSPERGQVSVNIIKPRITKGNHWHHTKNEKFVVVSGKGCVRFRKYGGKEIMEYHVGGDKLEVVDIPPGYVHSIINEGDTDLVTLMWCNECFDQEHPDTIFELVEPEVGGEQVG